MHLKKSLRVALLVAPLLGVFHHAHAADSPYWNFSSYGTSDPQKLFRISIDSESAAEKLRIRSYLAAKHEASMEGIASRAWVVAHEGRASEAAQLYRECVARFPKAATCLNNLMTVSKDDLDVRRRLLDADPAYNDYAAVRDTYTALGELGRKAEQAEFLQSMSQRFQGKWVVPFLKSLDANGRSDKQAQREYLRQATTTGDEKAPFFVYASLIRLETGYFFDGRRDRIDAAIELVVKYLGETRRFDEFEPWQFLIDEYASNSTNKIAILRQFVRTYDSAKSSKPNMRPLPAEVLDYVVTRDSAVANSDIADWIRQLRERFAARRATEPEVAYGLLRFETMTDAPLANLSTQWQQLVANALSEKTATTYSTAAIYLLVQQRGDCATSQRLATGWEQRFASNAAFHRNAFEAALCTNDLAAARRHTDAVARLDPNSGASDRTDRMRLAHAEAQVKAWNEQQKKTPFLTQWNQKDDGRVAFNIEFPSNSAAIPPRFADALDKMARLLKDNGAEDYQFDISGHTDNRGSLALNQKLSEQRAQAVVDYLVAKTGIQRERLSFSGQGSGFPVASNDTDAGMQQNRRVEIVPKAFLRAPVLAHEGEPGGKHAISPDGRLLATADGLWDIKSRLLSRALPQVPVKQMDFSPDGRTLVRLVQLQYPSQSDNVLELIDVASGLVRNRLLIGSSVETFTISPDGRKLALVAGGQLQVYALPSLKLRNQRMLSLLAGSGRSVWLDNDRLAASVRYGGEKLHIVNGDTLATQKTFDGVDYVHTVGVSRSGKYLVAISNDGALHRWDTKGWQHKAMDLGVYANRFQFHPFEELALIDQWNGSDQQARLLDVENMRVVKTLGSSSQGAFMPDGKHFFYNGREYDTTSLTDKAWNSAKAASASGSVSYGMSLPESGQLLTEYKDDSYVWDVASARQVDKLVGVTTCGQVVGSRRMSWKCGGPPHSVMIEHGTWRAIPSPAGYTLKEGQTQYAETATRAAVFEQDPAPRQGRVAKRGTLSILERGSGRVLATHKILLRLEDAVYSNDDALHNAGLTSAVDPSGRYLAVGVWWKEHWGYSALAGKQVRLYDLESGKEVDFIQPSERVENLRFAPGDTPRLRLAYERSTGVYNVANKKWEKNEPWSAKEVLAAEEGALKVVSLEDKLTLLEDGQPERYVFLRKQQSGVSLYPAQNLMLVYYGNGEYDYYDLKTLTRQLTLQARPQGEWIAYAPGGEFASSLRGSDGYFWALGDRYLPFGALRERFERPDIIERQLKGVRTGTAVAPVQLTATSLRQDSSSAPTDATPMSAPLAPAQSQASAATPPAPAIEADLFMPPFSLRLIDAPAKSRDAAVNLKVGITKLRTINAEPEVELNINGQQVKTRGLARVSGGNTCNPAAQPASNCEQIVELPVRLDDGRNVVQVSLLYRNARLETKTSVIELERPRQAGQAAPRLWLFAAGVSQYAESKQNLKFAHRDAEELAKLFKAQEGKLYSQVNTKVLTNQQVAKGTLDTEINRFLRQATEQDLIVILLAGHGVQDNDQTLYFMTHDANMDEPFSGLDVARIRGILRNRPANQKAVLLLDICHAGALGEGKRGTVSAEDAVKQLTQGTGITVLSSSTGRELSNEAEQYRGGHGAFTAAVLEGLEGKADLDAGNRDGVVSITELMTYVMRRVPEMTRNGQHPTSPSSERLQDFPVAVKP